MVLSEDEVYVITDVEEVTNKSGCYNRREKYGDLLSSWTRKEDI